MLASEVSYGSENRLTAATGWVIQGWSKGCDMREGSERPWQ